MADLIRQWVWTSLFLSFHLILFYNSINWTALADRIDFNLTKCGSMSLCQYKYPLDPGSQVLENQPNWNTKAIDSTFNGCRCDAECGRYGDCCLDAAAVYSLDVTSPWICLPMTMEADPSDQQYFMYMIGNCPANEEDQELVASCQRRNDPEFSYSHLTDIPVLSLITNRTYANIYCAQCHSDIQNLANWNISIDCNDMIENYNVSGEELFQVDNYRPGMRKWILYTDGIFLECSMVIEELRRASNYLKLTGGRRCIPSMDNCLPDGTDAAEGHKCHDIYTVYVTSSSKVFKKPLCLTCHNLSTDGSICMDQNPPPRRIHSFSMIVDFKFGGYHTNRRKRCKSNEIFDHFHETCHTVSCGSQFVKVAGTCVPVAHENKNRLSLNSSCPRINLIKNVDYYSLDNGTIVLNKTEKLFLPGNYELNENGTVQICANESYESYLETLKNYLRYSYTQRLLSDVCLTISVICLSLHIGIHILVPKLRNLPGKILLSLSCSLFLGQLLFLIGVGAREAIGYGWCATVAIVIHWSILSAIFWMNIMAFDVCRTFAGSRMNVHRHRASVHGRRTSFRFYSLYGWSCPTLIVLLAMLLDFTHITDRTLAPDYGLHQCWICNKNGLGLFFVLPMSLLLTTNFVSFGLTAWSIVKQWRESQLAIGQNKLRRTSGTNSFSEKQKAIDQAQQGNTKSFKRLRSRFFLYVKLALIMGLGWISAFIAGLADMPGLWYPFILLNTLQGTFIFLAFDCKRKVYYMVYEAVTKRPHPGNSWSSTRGAHNANQTIPRSPSQTAQAFCNQELRSVDKSLSV